MATYDLIGEKVLLEQIAKGNEIAFRRVFDLYKTKVYTFIVGFTHSRADAEEILQDTFLTLWQNRYTLNNIEHPRNYIYTVVRNKTFHYLKQASKSEKLMKEVWANLKEDHNSTDDLMHLRDSDRMIKDALNMLSEQKRYIFKLSRYEGLGHEQIAEQTGLSKSRVKNIIVEVLKFLRTYLEQCAGVLGLVAWFMEN
ncbi:RNA polymerase sigma-70 factor [Mucilaginibacter daejeonensis]|uniref:RNA polymerase sigma factor n=1 Tax=Mucilaginibacter daejeonensis TaxID=398049 RepID=UPI001D179B41|nr:RNA polymerase sigma-70 factor [Mucilaginibacter daejeonensis]UEG52186.1 RNA polymerase sigma-70 factor [Mucilaginibacter daejeonensis]